MISIINQIFNKSLMNIDNIVIIKSNKVIKYLINKLKYINNYIINY